MKANELTAMSKEQLEEKVKELKGELFGLRFQLATGQLQNTMQISQLKRDIARCKTIRRQKDGALERRQLQWKKEDFVKPGSAS